MAIMTTDQVPLFQLNQVSHHYGSVQALQDISRTVAPGSIGLIGQNGAGKSTLMQILLGLIRPSSGSAEVLGQPVNQGSLTLRGRIGYMPEREAFIPGLKGIEYVALAGQLSGMGARESQRRAHEVLSYLGLEEARYRPLEQYATGMKQRLKLAAALVHDPQFLILDEPTSGLDADGRTAMLEVLRTLSARPGRSMLLSSHLLGDIERICQTAMIMDQGRLAAHGRLDELRTSQQRVYRFGWEGSTDNASTFLQSLENRGAQLETDLERGRGRATVVSEWSNQWFFAAARQSGVVLVHLEPEEEDLAAVYQRIVTKGTAVHSGRVH
jgi:ABC-2 type transport system ATP-binding protein